MWGGGGPVVNDDLWQEAKKLHKYANCGRHYIPVSPTLMLFRWDLQCLIIFGILVIIGGSFGVTLVVDFTFCPEILGRWRRPTNVILYLEVVGTPEHYIA